jgi:hypothetical protein
MHTRVEHHNPVPIHARQRNGYANAAANTKPAPPQFANRAEREAYYYRKYCQEHGIEDVAAFAGDKYQPEAFGQSKPKPEPKSEVAGISPGVLKAAHAINGTMCVVSYVTNFAWNMCAVFTVIVFLMFALGAWLG